MNPLDLLREQFNGHVLFKEKRPGIQQLYAPLFHEDGDMMSIFLDLPKDASIEPQQPIRISDHGLTRMRLSYSFDIDTENKERIYHRILNENGIVDDDGALVLDTTPESLYPAVLQFAQAVGKVSNLRLFKREVLASLFEEMLAEFISSALAAFQPSPSVLPLPERDDLEVDWQFQKGSTPLYLFAVREAAKARLAVISCLEFQRAQLPFKSIVVHENFEQISRKDRSRLTSASDKQFISFPDFRDNAVQYLERNAA